MVGSEGRSAMTERVQRFRDELLWPHVLWLSVAWILLGIVAWVNNGFWAYMTLPLFAVADAWFRSRRRR